MKVKKNIRRYCPYCKTHTLHIVSEVKKRERGALKHGSVQRARKRGRGQGSGNKGRYSKPAISKWKRTGAKVSKKLNLQYKCEICKKASIQRQGVRTKKVEIK